MVHSYEPHDTGEPRQIDATRHEDWFETLSRAVFNAGISWSVVEKKWPAFGEAFAGFDPTVVATFDDEDVDRIADNPDVIRNRGKIRGTVGNARSFVDIVDEHGSFPAWLDTFDDYDARERALVGTFEYVGDFGAYWTLYTTQQPVPDYGDWCRAHGREPPAGM